MQWSDISELERHRNPKPKNVMDLIRGSLGGISQEKSLNWILLKPRSQGIGIGSAIVGRVSGLAHSPNVKEITIAASHPSAPFFAKFGVIEIAVIDNGWGRGMQCVDMELRMGGEYANCDLARIERSLFRYKKSSRLRKR